MKCDHCDSRINSGESFKYAGYDFCCGCMSMLCSWFLDGGWIEEPEMFGWITEERVTPGNSPAPAG